MLSLQNQRRLLHCLDIRLKIQRQDIFAVKDRLCCTGVAGIAVGLADGLIARVEAFGRFAHLGDADILRQIAVQIVADLLRRLIRLLQKEICGHRFRVNARIGASRADHIHRRAAHPGEHGLQLSLYGIAVWLVLPAVIARSVVGKRHFVVFLHASVPS